MSSRLPWKGIAVSIGVVLLVVIAFRAPLSSSGAEALDISVESATVADGAALVAATDSVTSPPEQQPEVSIPAPVPGQKPPQVIVVSVDGGCETPDGTIRHFMDTGQRVGARMTFFMTGLCLVPDSQRMAYHPPGKLPGQSDLPFADPRSVSRRIQTFADMYRQGHEIGTHFLGHFCGPSGVGTWSDADWRSEIDQHRAFLDNWRKYNPQAAAAPQLPFDSSVFQGDRTPCLEGDRSAMHKAFVAEGFRYDASDPGMLQWPRKAGDANLWLFPLPSLKLSGTNQWILSMDYNLLYNQNRAQTTGDAATCTRVEEQTYRTFMQALDAVYAGNRAPLFVGSHLNDWLCGAYIKATERFITDAAAKYPDAKLVTFADLADWLDNMDPATLKQLQQLPAQRY